MDAAKLTGRDARSIERADKARSEFLMDAKEYREMARQKGNAEAVAEWDRAIEAAHQVGEAAAWNGPLNEVNPKAQALALQKWQALQGAETGLPEADKLWSQEVQRATGVVRQSVPRGGEVKQGQVIATAAAYMANHLSLASKEVRAAFLATQDANTQALIKREALSKGYAL